MKTFKDLIFEPHPVGLGGTHATMDFENKYGISVIFGLKFYSNGIDTYEVAVIYDGHISYNSGITEDVIGYQTKRQVSLIMKKIQLLK